MTIADLLIITGQVVGVAILMAAALSHIAKALEFRESEMRRDVQAARLRVASSRARIKCAGRG